MVVLVHHKKTYCNGGLRVTMRNSTDPDIIYRYMPLCYRCIYVAQQTNQFQYLGLDLIDESFPRPPTHGATDVKIVVTYSGNRLIVFYSYYNFSVLASDYLFLIGILYDEKNYYQRDNKMFFLTRSAF